MKKFNVEQRKIAKIMLIALLCSFAAMLVMAALGDIGGIWKIIPLSTGWTGKLWGAIWMALTASLFFLLGMLCFATSEDEEK